MLKNFQTPHGAECQTGFMLNERLHAPLDGGEGGAARRNPLSPSSHFHLCVAAAQVNLKPV